MATYIPPWLEEPPHSAPRHKGARLGWVLVIAVAIALVGFLVALITAIVTAGPVQA